MSMIHLKVSPKAQNDLQEIKDYIALELENTAAALHVISKITKAMRRLIDFPNSGTSLSSIVSMETDYRFLVSGHYQIFYRHVDNNVYIVRVLYGKRDYLRILFGEESEGE